MARPIALAGLLLGLAVVSCGPGRTSYVAPTITGISPSYGPVTTTSITVTGSGFNAGVTGAAVGGVAATAKGTVTGDTQLSFTVPAAAVTGVVSVTTLGGTASFPLVFTVVPGFTGITPASGPAGTRVTGTGTGLMGITSVAIAAGSGPSVAATILTQTAQKLTFDIPNGASPGSSIITLTSAYGTAIAPLLQVVFTVN